MTQSWAGRNNWTDPQDDRLRRCVVEQGRSYTEAAAEINATFGLRISRNAAIGRAARLGITVPRKAKPAELPTAMAEPTARRPRQAKAAKPAPLPDVPPPAIEPDEPMAIDLPSDGVAAITILDLETHHCRFPLGELPYHFCGVPKREGFSYCAEHVAITHNRDGRR